MSKVDPALHARLETIIKSMGYDLFGCELSSMGRQMLFRIYIDSPRGVTIDDCSLVSHQISAMMDVEDPIKGRYVLEVSSPGIDRPLFELAQYRRYIGNRIKVKLYVPIEQRRQFKGILQQVDGETIHLLVDETGQAISVPFSDIEKANLIGEVQLNSPKK